MFPIPSNLERIEEYGKTASEADGPYGGAPARLANSYNTGLPRISTPVLPSGLGFNL